ncbi:MAG: hypothetical protein GY835_06455 [bacterium]|nr:hypothetical protein [bacterium]
MGLARQGRDLGIWWPVFRRASERWLSLALVIDSSPSMRIWSKTLAELKNLLQCLGAFREVRTWSLDAADFKAPSLSRGQGAPRRAPRELLDPAGRRLVMVVTDGAAPAWYSPGMKELLDSWAQHQPVTLLQMLPRRLWQRTGLVNASLIRVRSLRPGTPNVRLQVKARRPFEASREAGWPPIPIVALDPTSLDAWARFLAGWNEASVCAALFYPDEESPAIRKGSFWSGTDEQTMTTEEKTRTFWRHASRPAVRLARVLTAVLPSTLPVVRLVQRVMLPDSGRSHLAEILLGDLIRPVGAVTGELDPERILYDFYPEVGERLKENLDLADIVHVRRLLDLYVSAHAGNAPDFAAVVADEEGPLSISTQERPFASLPTSPWRKTPGGDSEGFFVGSRTKSAKSDIPRGFRDEVTPPTLVASPNILVSREHLFQPLLELIAKRKLVFLTGGHKSGRKTFQRQFEEYMRESRSHNFHHVDFRSTEYDQILKFRRHVANEGGVARYQFINSLFAALALSAYRQIRWEHSPEFDTRWIDEFVPSSARSEVVPFCEVYFSGKMLVASAANVCVEHFLGFLSKLVLMREQNNQFSMTVFMPYDEVSKFIGLEPADERSRVIQELWLAMLDFCQVDLSLDYALHPGAPARRNFFEYELGSPIGVVIGVSAVPVGTEIIGADIMKHSVFAIPPLSIEETRHLAHRVLGVNLNQKNVSAIYEATGGAPWFVKLILASLIPKGSKLREGGSLNGIFEETIAEVEYLLAGGLSDLETPAPEVREDIEECLERLTDVLQMYHARDDPKILWAWKAGGIVPRSRRLEQWLKTGLIWLDQGSSEQEPGISAFSQYPRMRLQRAARLPLKLYEGWKRRSREMQR